MMRKIMLIGLVMLLAATVSTCQGADSGSDFSAMERFIGSLPTNLPPHQGMQWLVQWPSTNEIRDTFATNDISSAMNPPPPKSPEEDRKPSRLPVESPDEALFRARQFMSMVFKSEWLPNDIATRLLPLRSPDLKNSRVLFRYDIEDYRIQAIQKRSYMCIVIAPKKANASKPAPIEHAEWLLKKFFTRGEEMIAVPYKREERGKYTVAVPLMKGDRDDWWRSALWVTDGRSLAVLLPRRLSTQQRLWEANEREPWF